MLRIVVKTETDAIAASRILCCVIIDLETGEAYRCADAPGYTPLAQAYDVIRDADQVICHSGFHRRVLKGLIGIEIPDARFVDTLDLARAEFGQTSNKLSEWARRLECPRTPYKPEAEQFSEAMMRHCVEDARAVEALYAMCRAAEAESGVTA